MRGIGVEERRARIARRHRLAPSSRSDDPVEIAGGLVGLHATDPASVYLAAAARLRVPELAAVQRALYDDRTLIRMLGMRRTMFVLPVDLGAIVQAACTGAIAVRERRKLEQMIDGGGLHADAAAHLRKVEQATLETLAGRGEATGAELSGDVPELRQEFPFGVGTKWEGVQTLTTRLLVLLGAEGRVVRGRPRGSWISSQYRWAPIGSWLPAGLEEWSIEVAQAELARRWLASFGPGTVADLRWWTGWTAGETKRALAALETVEVDVEGGTALMLADDQETIDAVEPWVALLPALDPTVMGWARRDWYLGPHGPALFDRSGNAGPTVWCDGHVVGGWAQRKDGEIAFRLFEDVGSDAADAVAAAAHHLGGLIGAVRVTPRFRTPLERELAA